MVFIAREAAQNVPGHFQDSYDHMECVSGTSCNSNYIVPDEFVTSEVPASKYDLEPVNNLATV